MHFLVLLRHCLAPILDYAFGKFALLFDLFGESREKNSGVGDDRQIHRRQFLKVAGPAAHDDIFEGDIDHFAAGFGRRNVGVRVRIRAHQRAVEIGHVESHDDVGVGDQLAVPAGKVQRMSVGKIQARTAIDHGNRQEIGERHQAHHRIVVPPHIIGQDHRILR